MVSAPRILYDVIMCLLGPIIYGLYYFSFIGKPVDVPDCWTVEGRDCGYTQEQAEAILIKENENNNKLIITNMSHQFDIIIAYGFYIHCLLLFAITIKSYSDLR